MSLALIATIFFVWLISLVRPMSAQDQQLLYWYQAPVGFVFVLFVWDRWQHRNSIPFRGRWLIDLLVILISISRTITWFLPLSGHALFLTYAIGTSINLFIRVLAGCVLLEAIAIKHFWLQDDITPWVGMSVGLAVVLIEHTWKLIAHARKIRSANDANE